VPLPDGTSRVFLEDGDVLTVRATAPGEGGSIIGFGEVSGVIVPTVEAEPTR
jgi:fumarylacetoacetase